MSAERVMDTSDSLLTSVRDRLMRAETDGTVDDTIDAILAADAAVEYPAPDRRAIRALERSDALPSYYKVDLLLTAAGDKPMSFMALESERWSLGDAPAVFPADKDRAFRDVASGLGLTTFSADRVLAPTAKNPGVILRNMIVARSPVVAAAAHHVISESFSKRSGAGFVYDERNLGKMLGYPDTAVAAYAEHRSHTDTSHVRDLEMHAFSHYALSDDNEAEELLTGKRWAATIKALSPALYDTEMSGTAAYLKETGTPFDDQRRRMARLYARFLRSRDI